ncbi:MAG: energy transducer TonB [Bacteriovoracaceae bacterium]
MLHLSAMYNSPSFENIPRSMLLSVLFHALIFVTFGYKLSEHYKSLEQSLSPKGVLVEMGSFATNAPVQSASSRVSKTTKETVKSPVVKSLAVSDLALDAKASSTIGNSTTSSNGLGNVGDPNGVESSALERYIYELKLVLEQNKQYPNQARMLGQEGKVTVSFTLKKDGSIIDVKISESSTYSKLNEAALKLIESLKQFKPFPSELKREQWTLNVPIQYSLE